MEANLSDSPETSAAPQPGIADHLIGRHVIIRATGAGVHAGILEAYDGQTVRLSSSRRLWRWSAAKGHTLSGVALHDRECGFHDSDLVHEGTRNPPMPGRRAQAGESATIAHH